MIDKLRDEIIESEKARTDFLKWKLILVAAIGGAGLGIGLSEKACSKPVALLALIPFVSLYVDAVCFHNQLRIMAIAKFLRTKLPATELARQYEQYCTDHRSHFSLEHVALLATTLFLSILVFSIGYSENLRTLLGIDNQAFPSTPLLWSGAIGFLAGWGFYGLNQYRGHKFDQP